MAPKYVYNVDETGVFYHSQPNKTLVQRKIRGCEIQKDHLILAIVVNMKGTENLTYVIMYKSLRSKCFGKVVASKFCVVVCNPNGMDDIICISKLNDEPQCTFKSHKQQVLLIVDKYVTHSIVHVGMGESFGFQPCS